MTTITPRRVNVDDVPRASFLRYNTHNKKRCYTLPNVYLRVFVGWNLQIWFQSGFTSLINFHSAHSCESDSLDGHEFAFCVPWFTSPEEQSLRNSFCYSDDNASNTNIRFHSRETYSVTSIVRLPITIVILFPLIIKYSFWYNRLSTMTNARHLY